MSALMCVLCIFVARVGWTMFQTHTFTGCWMILLSAFWLMEWGSLTFRGYGFFIVGKVNKTKSNS